MMNDGNADKMAVRLVLSGNGAAYGDIVHRYKNIVFNVVQGMVKNYHTAEDITQDTFIDGYFKLKSLQEPEKIGAWLVRIAKNKCLNFITRSALKYEHALHEHITDISFTPENALIKQQERLALMQALERLPEAHKLAATLYYFHGYPQGKIAELLNTPVGTVGRRLYDVRIKLRKELIMSDTIVNKNFEAEVAQKVKAIQDYYPYDGFDSALAEAASLIGQMPESKEKHAAYADIYFSASFNDAKHLDRAMQEAELSQKADILASCVINKYLGTHELFEKCAHYIPIVKKMPGHSNALGELLFWSAWRDIDIDSNTEEAAFIKAKATFDEAAKHLNKSNSYYANAIAGSKLIDQINDAAYILCRYSACGEQLYYKNGKLILESQPGRAGSDGSAKNKYESLFYYVSYITDAEGYTFFDEHLPIGGIITNTQGRDEKSRGSTHTLLSKNATVSVPSGTFTDCLHIQLHGFYFGWIYEADVYYAPGVGLVKAVFTEGKTVERYELHEYKVCPNCIGSRYMPFAAGNYWRYANMELPSAYKQFIEREIAHVDNDTENGGIRVYFSAVGCLRLKKETDYTDDYDSNTYIILADKAVPYRYWHEKPKKMDFDAAIRYLKFAVQRNSSVRATLFAAAGVSYLERFKQYHEKGWHMLPCTLDARVLRKDKQAGRIICINAEGYALGPSQDAQGWGWNEWKNERKCLARNPFRYLQYLFGSIYDEKWVAGHSEQIKHDDGEMYVKAENGGTVTTKAGSFGNCLKVTVELEKPGQTDPHYYTNTPQYSHCGTKIYHYAPNVGIVKYECHWGKELYACMELSEYISYATGGEYMPIYVGNRWVYDEVTLPPQYREKTQFTIASGMEDEFFMLCEGDVLFMGTEGEYAEFQKKQKIN